METSKLGTLSLPSPNASVNSHADKYAANAQPGCVKSEQSQARAPHFKQASATSPQCDFSLSRVPTQPQYAAASTKVLVLDKFMTNHFILSDPLQMKELRMKAEQSTVAAGMMGVGLSVATWLKHHLLKRAGPAKARRSARNCWGLHELVMRFPDVPPEIIDALAERFGVYQLEMHLPPFPLYVEALLQQTFPRPAST